MVLINLVRIVFSSLARLFNRLFKRRTLQEAEEKRPGDRGWLSIRETRKLINSLRPGDIMLSPLGRPLVVKKPLKKGRLKGVIVRTEKGDIKRVSFIGLRTRAVRTRGR